MPKVASPIRAKSKGIFTVKVVQDPYLVKALKGMKSKPMFKEIEKGLVKGLLRIEKQSQKNITAMKAVLSGWMRTSHEKFLVRPSAGSLVGILFNNAWYAQMVHDGLSIHANPPTGGFVKPGNLTPKHIQGIQRARLKLKKKSFKGPRPFLANAAEQQKDAAVDEVFAGFNRGVERSFRLAGRKVRKYGK